MKTLNLADADLDRLGWTRASDGYLDFDKFNEVNVVAVMDGMSSEIIATVLFAGTPVLVVRSDSPDARLTYAYAVPEYVEDRGADAQAFAAFMEAIGEFAEESAAWVVEHGLNALYAYDDAPEMGDGHELTWFVGVIARAIHAAYPDDTPKPQGW